MKKFKKPTLLNKFLSALAVGVIFVALVYFSMKRIGLNLDFSTLLEYKKRLFDGFKMTIIISFASLIFSMILGMLTAMGQRSQILVICYACRTYIQIIRGTPLLVQIYFFFYIVGTAWGIDNRYIAGVIILSIFEGAYISEIIRGGIESIDKQEYEIARSIGITDIQTLWLVTFPILMARILPALAGQLASIIKDSSLLSVIAVIELTQTIQEISAANFQMFENYIFLGLLYFILTFAVSMLTKWLEGRYKHENRD
ncbi:MAG TPA: amino acid ABC transporter permease [Clostridiaceae bacterium]